MYQRLMFPAHGKLLFILLFVLPYLVVNPLKAESPAAIAPSIESVVVFHDNREDAIAFSARHLAGMLESQRVAVALAPLAELTEPRPSHYVVLATQDDMISRQLAAAGAQPLPETREQAFSIRTTQTDGSRGYWAIGGDRIGTMYAGIHLAELVAARSLAQVTDEDQRPYIAKRGLKFNIPLDGRSPSFDDGGAAAVTNRDDVWDLDFWREYLDTIALQRYNVLSLWNRHPFPSLVKLDDYPEVALHDVQDRGGKVIKRMTIDDRIAFWNQVLEMGYHRGIEMWFMVWNVELHAAEGKHGITTAKDNAVTKDYLYQSVKQYLLSYPRMAGIGITAGEKMHEFTTAGEKEQWLWDTYGRAVMEVKRLQPERHIRFVHRHWLTEWDEIGSRFGQLPDGFEMAVKYAQARLYSATNPSWAAQQLKDIPEDMATWWNLRNDDIFIQRWGDPDYVREYILNFPDGSERFPQSPRLTAGYIMGSDRYFWARESMSKHPQSPRQLENDKHWYRFLLWGRLGYDPETPDDIWIGLIQHRFPSVDGKSLFNAWQSASRIIPAINRFNWWPWDYFWWVEKGTGNGFGTAVDGYHTINDIIKNPTQNVSGYMNIEDFVNGERNGTTPLEVAFELEANAMYALAELDGMSGGEQADLRETLGDIRSQAYLGLHWAHKIRGGVALQRFRMTAEETYRTAAIEHLTASSREWERYADQLDASYEKVRFAGHGVFDWHALSADVRQDIEIARHATSGRFVSAVEARVLDPNYTEPVPWGTDFNLEDLYQSASFLFRRAEGAYEIANYQIIVAGSGSEGVLETSWIDISDGPVSVNVRVRSKDKSRFGGNAYIRVYTTADDGAETLIGTVTGAVEAGANISGTAEGERMKLMIRVQTNSGNETYFIEEMRVEPI